MDPHLSAIPMLGVGQSSGAYGQSLLPRSHIILTGGSRQFTGFLVPVLISISGGDVPVIRSEC